MKKYKSFLFIMIILLSGFVSVNLLTGQNVYGMEILVGTVSEHGTISFEVEPSDSIRNLKTRLEIDFGYNKDLITLTFNGQVLEDDNTFAYYGITAGRTIIFQYRESNFFSENIVLIRWISISIGCIATAIFIYTLIDEARLKKMK